MISREQLEREELLSQYSPATQVTIRRLFQRADSMKIQGVTLYSSDGDGNHDVAVAGSPDEVTHLQKRGFRILPRAPKGR